MEKEQKLLQGNCCCINNGKLYYVTEENKVFIELDCKTAVANIMDLILYFSVCSNCSNMDNLHFFPVFPHSIASESIMNSTFALLSGKRGDLAYSINSSKNEIFQNRQ